MTLLHAIDGHSAGFLSAFGFPSLSGFALLPYSVRELLSSWLLFAAFFVCVALLIFVSVLALHAAEYLIQWARIASRATGKVDVPVHVPRASL